MDEIKAIPRSRYIGLLADALRGVKDNTGIFGDFLLGEAPQTLDQWSYGFSPVRMGRTDQGLAGALYGMKVDPGIADVVGIAGMAPPAGKVSAWAGREALRSIDGAMLGGGNRLMTHALAGVRPLRMVDDEVKSLPEKYFRRNNNPSSPENDVGYSMFADSAERIGHYGNVPWEFSPSSVSPSEILDARDARVQREIARQLLKDKDLVRSYGAHPRDLAKTANPDDIVNSAGLWDAPDLVSHLYERYLGQMGYKAVITNDGAVLFEPSAARKAIDGAW